MEQKDPTKDPTNKADKSDLITMSNLHSEQTNGNNKDFRRISKQNKTQQNDS